MEENKRLKIDEIVDLFGFSPIDASDDKFVENNDEPSPYVQGYHTQAMRNWLYVFSLQLPVIQIPDSRLIISESEYIKPLDRITFKDVEMNLKTKLIFKNREDSIIYHEYTGMNSFDSSSRNYINHDGTFFLNYNKLSENIHKTKFKELQDTYGEDLIDFKVCPEKDIFIKLVDELSKEKRARLISFDETKLNLHLAEHRMLFVDKFISLDFSVLYWTIFLNMPLGLNNKFRENLKSCEIGLITRDDAYNACLYYLDEYLKIEFQ